MSKIENKIGQCLWFDFQAEQAANFYVSVFNNAEIVQTNRYPKEGQEIHGQPQGSVMTVKFQLEDQGFMALNGGPQFKLNPAISFFVNCKTKDEVDRLWEKLADGGNALMSLDKYPFSKWYGWVQDKFGLSWQLMLIEGKQEQKIIPSLMFTGEHAGKAGEAIGFYTFVFKDAKAGHVARYGAGQEPNAKDNVMYADFTLLNQKFAAMDSAQDHPFNFNEAISFIVNCDIQEEVDYYWEKLGEEGDEKAQQCGWLKDKFGVSWQVVPRVLPELLNLPDQEKSQRVFKAMLQMKKLDIKTLENA